MVEKLILVNEMDEAVGSMEKMQAHREGKLHRAFSVFIFNGEGDLLLQKRAETKYHSAGLWSNTCCSHPRPGEETEVAAKRRLFEEMGMQTDLAFLFHFTYHAVLEDDLIEHEIDHVLVGFSDDQPQLNHDEVEAYKYMDIADIEADMFLNPLNYTVWFRKCFHQVMRRMHEILENVQEQNNLN